MMPQQPPQQPQGPPQGAGAPDPRLAALMALLANRGGPPPQKKVKKPVRPKPQLPTKPIFQRPSTGYGGW